MEVGRVIGAADQRPGCDMGKALGTRDLTVRIEALGRNEFDDGQMLRAGPEILPEGEDLAAYVPEIVHRLEKLRLLFPKAEHDPAFRHDFRRQLFRLAQDFE